MKSLKFAIVEGNFTVHQVKSGTAIPKGITDSPFFSISGSADGFIIIAPDAVWVQGEKTDPDWVCFKIIGALDHEEIEALAGLLTALAKAAIESFSVAGFEAHYLLFKNEHLAQAKQVLAAEGHKIARPARSAYEEVRTTPQMNAYAAMIERHFPLIKTMLIEKVGLSTLSSMKSEAALFKAVGGLYEFMPPPVKLLVNQDLFVNYCIKNIERILPEVTIPARQKIVKKAK